MLAHSSRRYPSKQEESNGPPADAGDRVRKVMCSYLFSFIHFFKQIFTECLPCAWHCAGCWSRMVCSSVQEVTIRLSLEKGDGNSSGKMRVGGRHSR